MNINVLTHSPYCKSCKRNHHYTPQTIHKLDTNKTKQKHKPKLIKQPTIHSFSLSYKKNSNINKPRPMHNDDDALW